MTVKPDDFTTKHLADQVYMTAICFTLFKNSEYDQEIPQSQTADNPMAPQCLVGQVNMKTR